MVCMPNAKIWYLDQTLMAHKNILYLLILNKKITNYKMLKVWNTTPNKCCTYFEKNNTLNIYINI